MDVLTCTGCKHLVNERNLNMSGEKKLGLPSAISVCVGLIVATSCLVSLGNGVGLCGKAFVIPMFVVMILNIFIAISFAELHSLMPNVTGGTSQYILAGMGPVISIISNIGAYFIVMTLSSTVELTMCGMVISELFFPQTDPRIISIIIMVIFFIISLLRIDIFAKIQNFAVYLLLAFMLFLGIVGTFGLGTGAEVAVQTAPTYSSFGEVMSASAIAFWLFIGVEYVIPISKDLKNPKRDILLSMVLGLVILFIVQALMGTGMANYVSLDILKDSNTPHMIYASNLLGKAGQYIMGLITILAAVSALNVVYTSVSKILAGMAEDGMLPRVFAKTNRFGASYVGVILIAAFNLILVLLNVANTQGVTFLVLSASVFWLITYCMVHITVIKLRIKYPDRPRKKYLTLLGIPQIIGIIGNIYMIWNISDSESRIKIYILCGILLAIMLIYALIWVCLVMKAKPFKTVDIDTINNGDLSFRDIIK